MENTETITRERLHNDIQNLGIKKGDHLVLFVSYRNVGKVVGGPRGLVQALLDVVGPEGTIMVPTFTQMYPISMVKRLKVPVFNKEKTPSVDGIVSESVRTDERSFRSSHPTNSFAAIGAKAEFLLKDHDYRTPTYSPYSKLAEIRGKALNIGVDHRLLGGYHEAQYKTGLLSLIPPRYGALYLDDHNSEQVYIRRDLGGCIARIPYMYQNLKKHVIVTEGFIGQAKAVTVPSRESLEIMTDLMAREPENYVCDSARCLWCREVERRLKLSKKVKDGRWFHKYPVLRFFLDSYNYFLVRDIPAYTWSRSYTVAFGKKMKASLKAYRRNRSSHKSQQHIKLGQTT